MKIERFVGLVTKTIGKSAEVRVERRVLPPKYPKMITCVKNSQVADASEFVVPGDTVAIQRATAEEGFKVLSIVGPARRYKDPISGNTYTAP